MTRIRLAALGPLPAGHRPIELVRAVDALVGASHRLLAPATGPCLVPGLTVRLPAPAALLSLVRALSGRLVVANPIATVRLPWAVGALVRAVLRHALDPEPPSGVAPPAHGGDARARADARRRQALAGRLPAAPALLAPGAAWGVAALYEPTALTVTLGDERSAPPEPEPVAAVATLCYRLAIGVRRTPSTTDGDGRELLRALDTQVDAASATPWPPGARADAPWFARRVLLPDALAAAHMDQATLARWAVLTGRGGPAPRDRYWFSDSWERFREPGRQVGHVTPDDVARSRRPRPSSPAVSPWSAAPAPTLDPAAERGVCVPPGYCLVECRGTLEVSVVAL